ncbi:hypothetical protein N7508_003178, partial [Penicillium antarcticum]|uniref:uncharacterized protein n=1 Tax=Penicillium antarcticum TaxID=416450 RepID=UPI00239F2DC4
TIPWVGDGPDYVQGYGAEVLDSHGDVTSYAISCLATKTACQPFSPDLTVIAGPGTYDMIGTGVAFDIKSDCTFIGEPTRTLATCVQTISYHSTPRVITSSITVTGTQNLMTGIYAAMLRMTETGKPTTTEQSTTTEELATTELPASTATSSLATTTTESSTMTEPSTAARNETQASEVTGIQIPPRPGNSTSYSNSTETVTVTMIVTETPAAFTSKCDCEYPTHAQTDETVLSRIKPNVGNTITAKRAAMMLMGAILVVIVFCI